MITLSVVALPLMLLLAAAAPTDATTTTNGVRANGPTFDSTDCLDAQMIDLLKRNGIPGANLAVMKHGAVAYEQGYGTRDAPGIDPSTENRPVLPSTPFRSLSVTKSLTALTILLLAQDGLLQLDDLVFGDNGGGGGGVLNYMIDEDDEGNSSNNTPSLLLDPRVLDITIRHLLQHTSGFATLLDESDPSSSPRFASGAIIAEWEARGERPHVGPPNCADLIGYLLRNAPLSFPPGTQYEYSNVGYCVLGRVIEAVTNQSYEEAVKQWLLVPARVNLDEMYLATFRLEDVPEDESEYYVQPPLDEVRVPSAYPQDMGKLVGLQYGVFAGGFVDSFGGWVATPRQLLRIVKSVFPPHCEHDASGSSNDDDKDKNVCLLDEIWLEELAAPPTTYDWTDRAWHMGLGHFVLPGDNEKDEGEEDTVGGTVAETTTTRDGDLGKDLGNYRDRTLVMNGQYPGSIGFVVRMNVVHDDNNNKGYAYAALFNCGNETGMMDRTTLQPIFDGMAQCVDDKDWPVLFYALEDALSSASSLKCFIFVPRNSAVFVSLAALTTIMYVLA